MARVSSSMVMAERISWYCALLVALMLALSCCEPGEPSLAELGAAVREKHQDVNRPCDEIYVVRDGETLQTIGDKCGDPYIVERNPHIHDPDDVFPGLVIKIISSNKSEVFETLLNNTVVSVEDDCSLFIDAAQ